MGLVRDTREGDAESSSLCEAVLNASPDPIFLISPSGTIEMVSARTEPVLGWSPEELVGQPIELLVPMEARRGHAQHRESYFERPRAREMGARRQLEALRKDGSRVPVEISLSPMVLDGDRHVVAIVRDVTERRAMERELEYASTHDSLTGVYNRAFFEAEVERLDQGREVVSVLVIDIDGLKSVNDDHGHAEGDLLLRRMATALRTSFRSEDVVARIGGDEFAVLLPGVEGEELRRAVRRLLDDAGRMNEVHRGHPVRFSIGGGTATIPGTLQATIRTADARMYREKQKRKRGRSR